MGGIFEGTEVIPIDQIVGESVSNLRNRNKGGDRHGGSQNPVVEQLDKIIVLLGRLAFQPDNIQIPPKVYSIDLTQIITDAPLGMTRIANSITFLKPDADFMVKFGVLINGNEVIMTESKKIPLGRDTVINGVIIQDIYYTTTGAAGANPVEVFAAWI
jgi:hypothetical protein